jgi:Flp pilus assembly protein TadD
MSLVNDMLRDLDQRRKSSDSASSSVSLMPASDMPVEKKNRILLIVALALVIVVALLAYLWSQQIGADAERRLNINPPVVSTSPATGAVSEVVELPDQNEPQSQSNALAPGILAETQVAAPESELASEPTIDESISSTISETGFAREGADPTAMEQTASTTTPSTPVEPAAAQTGIRKNTAAELNSLPANTANTGVSSVINQPAAESVKNNAQMSAEQLDTMAVQAALRMIQENNTAGAYAHLEQHVIQNRYAHQSRETYAKLLMNAGELLAAYNLVESGLGLAPNHPGFKKVKARILIADGQIPEAVEILTRRAPSIEDDLEYHEILATAQLASRDYRGALISYSSLVQQDQKQGKWWYGYAASQDSLGNSNAARQAYNRAVQQPNLSPNLRRRSQERLATLSE